MTNISHNEIGMKSFLSFMMYLSQKFLIIFFRIPREISQQRRKPAKRVGVGLNTGEGVKRVRGGC